VAETLEVPCFRYHGQELAAPLVVEPGDGPRLFVRCMVRDRIVCLTPEERVRQGLAWFLTERADRADILSQHLRIGIEERSLDVAGFAAGEAIDERFAPYVTAVIIEAKRWEEELSDHAAQLRNYMLRERCRAGLLFNGRQATWLRLDGDFAAPDWLIEPLSDLSEVEQRIEEVGVETSGFMAACRRLFVAARAGDFDSFLRLVELFGDDAGLTFGLSMRSKGSLGSVAAFNLGIDAERRVAYRVRGVQTRHRQRLSLEEFHGLLSIRPQQ
jgi:hypothetical protein